MTSPFFSNRFAELTPYTPGEQPQDRSYVKLNTNESPFAPAPAVAAAVAKESALLHLYSDPECRALREVAAKAWGVDVDSIVFGNGSDEILNLAFMAFGSAHHPLVFPDITYGFYPVFARLNNVAYRTVPLQDDFTIGLDEYCKGHETVCIANPNAPTGRALPRTDIERLVASDPSRVVIVDEAYVDFGGESAIELTQRYDNLLVVGTFSKSRSLAGARLGFAIGAHQLIEDLNTLRYSINPYNVNRMTMAAGIAALQSQEYYDACIQEICAQRSRLTTELEARGIEVVPSCTNFVFARCVARDTSGFAKDALAIGGRQLYQGLKARGVLVRHFDTPRTRDFVRITVGTAAQVDSLLEALDDYMLDDCRAQGDK